ncbi:MAG: S8 family peptidase [Lachnospiraceae bacterium]|nr:S8 family peptidase [Lachnospiraceae bacterium]
MNPLLQVKLRFDNEKNKQQPGARNLRANAETTTDKIDSLIESLRAVLRFYRDNRRITRDIMIDINYNDIIAKSNRVKALLKPSRRNINDTIVGARFSDAPDGEENHIITHYVDEGTIESTINELVLTRAFLDARLGGKATTINFTEPNSNINYDGFNLSKAKLRDIVIDCSVVDSFAVPHISAIPDKDKFLITFYKSELPLSLLLEKLKIDNILYTTYGDDTISVTKELFEVINKKVPYMISMISTDLSQVKLNDLIPQVPKEKIIIPPPANEPVIGVIDTLFDESVYFSEWVDNVDYLNDIERTMTDMNQREHGTQVTSIIVDGPRMNPWLDDGCGRFRVRHFGVCSERISTARLVKKIKEIVDKNPDIHVWNLSLGTEDEVSKNFVSYDAAALDEIQSKKNVIFVVSGTNDNRTEKKGIIRVGSPADSINSLVVNSVRRDGRPASYSREGNILSFYNKPDVSYYGGDYDDKIVAYSPYGSEGVSGTSFAAPWISRKMCYLIDIMGMSKEVAKALIIDAAAGWDYKLTGASSRSILGYGIVPIDIRKIVETESDEIRFVLYGTSEAYRTTNYAIPVPKDKDNKYPYIARAALCYFPKCSRSQGVDYTNLELSLQFGRIKADGKIDDINQNVQEDSDSRTDERQSRKEFRKWDNTKFISCLLRKNRAIKSYDERLWGISVTKKDRLNSQLQETLNFGVVITLKEINGVNRIDDFIKACTLRGWIVNRINVQNKLDVYASSQEEIHFE